MFAAIRPTVTRGNVRVGTLSLIGSTSAPSSDTCRLLARDHAAPESTLALAKATSLGRGRVRPLAWCSRPRSSTALPEGSPFFLPLLEHLQHAVRDDEAAHDVRGSQYYGDQPDD